MAVFYFGTEKLNEKDFPSNRKYIIIVKPVKPLPDKGKKRLSTEKREKYEFEMKQYNKCIELLESGHVDIYNNYLETEDSDKFAVDILLNGIDENRRIFRIKPIQSKKSYSNYSMNYKLTVSEFDVEKEIKSEDDLLDIIIENLDYYSLEEKLFYHGACFENKRKKSFEIFGKLHEKTFCKFLGDLIHNYGDSSFSGCIGVHSYHDNQKAHDYAKELMDAGYVKLFYKNDKYIHHSIIRFLKLKWTDFALDTIKGFIGRDEYIDKIKESKEVRELLSFLNDDENVKEIMKILKLETNKLELVVEKDIDGGYRTEIVERKEFSDMGVLRSYLITEYKMPFEMASKDIKDTYWNGKTFNIKQKNNE